MEINDIGPFITLTGLGEYSYEDDYTGETIEGVCMSFKNNGRGPELYLFCSIDPNDGYRSYGSYAVIEKKNPEIRLFPIAPQQECTIQLFDGEVGSEEWPCRNRWIEIRTCDGDNLVLRVGTENYEDWYPMAIFEYHPEAFGEIQYKMPNC